MEGSRLSYRELVEDVNSIVMLMDIEGTIIPVLYANRYVSMFFGTIVSILNLL
jgi:hypothetical protein